MKISKKILLYIGITAYIFIVGIMAFVLFQQMDERDTVTNQLAETQNSLNMLHPANLVQKQAELEAQLSDVTSETELLTSKMASGIGNVDAGDVVFRIAAKEDVRVLYLSSPAPSLDEIENIPCDATMLTATVQGDVLNLVDFVTELNTVMETGMIHSVEMQLLEGDNRTSSTAMISLQVFDYKGD